MFYMYRELSLSLLPNHCHTLILIDLDVVCISLLGLEYDFHKSAFRQKEHQETLLLSQTVELFSLGTSLVDFDCFFLIF